MTSTFPIEPLSSNHDRRAFRCGIEALDRYIHEQVTQDIRRKVTSCYVARAESSRMAGFYTIAMGGVSLGEFPIEIVRKLPRYPSVPAARIGRLAVDLEYRGQGVGSVLLLNAVARAIRADIAVFAVIVDAKDESAKAFYLHHGFIPFASLPGSLFLPLTEAARRIMGR